MKSWSDLQVVLQGIMGDYKVYYQPPENLKLTYPCITYETSDILSNFADNNPYHKTKRYLVTLITKTADNHDYLDALSDLPMCVFDREFKKDGLVHDVFSLYF